MNEPLSFAAKSDAAKDEQIARALKGGMIEVDARKLDRLQNSIKEMAPVDDPSSPWWDLLAISRDLRS